MKYHRRLAAITIGLALLPVTPMLTNGLIPKAMGGSTTTTMTVSATVPTSCNFTGGSVALAFGSYDPTGPNATANLNATTTFGLRCTKGASAVLSMNNGSNASGTQRRMTDNGTNFLNYQVYTNNTYSTIWNTTNTVSYTATSANPTNISVYGQIPAGQTNVPAGTYHDTVVITAKY